VRAHRDGRKDVGGQNLADACEITNYIIMCD
jgi:hypothetical protein